MNKIFLFLLSSTATYNAAHAMEQYPLIDAARSGDLQHVHSLLDGGADVNQQNNVGDTALHVATTAEIAKLLLDRGAHINRWNMFLCRPIYPAVVYNRQDIVLLLLERGTLRNLSAKAKLGTSILSKIIRTTIAAKFRGLNFNEELLAHLQENPDSTLLEMEQGLRRINQDMNASHVLGTLKPSLAEMAALLGHHCIVELLENWPKVEKGCCAGQDAFCMAMHPRVGAESPVQMLPQYAFQQICNYVRPAVLIHDQEAVEAYKHTAERITTQQSCTIC